MREIKFRAWDKQENKMIVPGFISNNPKWNLEKGNILMQCTGLKDIRGRYIYEGDILKYYSISENLFMIIRFGDYREGCGSNLGFYVEHVRKKQRFYRRDLIYWIDESEVIGNIYENPKLLEVNDELEHNG